jgi:hypothetical protein
MFADHCENNRKLMSIVYVQNAENLNYKEVSTACLKKIVPFSKIFLWAPDVIFIPKGR